MHKSSGRIFRLSGAAITALLLAVLSGCGSDGGGGGGGAAAGNTEAGILFGGSPTALTMSVVVDYDSGDRTRDNEISVDPDGVEIDRTNVEVALVDTATVGEVNTLLELIEGRIVSMIEGVNIIVVKIPDPGDLAGLAVVIATLEASPQVDWVMQADMSDIDSLPGNFDPATTDLSTIDHHLAVLAPAAWNARAALDYPVLGKPLMLQADFFGGGVPDADFDINVLDPTDFFSLAATPDQHGYHVLGIMSGRHTVNPAAASQRDWVTGMYPGTMDLRVVDRASFNRPLSENQIVRIIRQSGRRVVLNTSLNSGCPRPPQQACVLPKTYSWLRKLRGDIAYFSGQRGVWEDNFLLHMTSAGNFKTTDPDGNALNPPDDRAAAFNSQYAATLLVSGLVNSKGIAVPNVSNTMVVENRVNTNVPFQPGCLFSSKESGDISAIGTQVWSFTDWTTTAENLSGTSMSTPQVAALAAYIWALKPTLKPDEVINILRTTASTFVSDAACAVLPSRVIDAYTAVLAVDDAKAIDPMFANPMDAPARLAIFDVVGDGGSPGANRIFDEDDLTGFVNAFVAAGGVARDYSRFDLNGDSYTGGTVRSEFFNLDIDAAQVLGMVDQDIEGDMIAFDESAVTDWEILCYYAYSPLYTGSVAERTITLGSICGSGSSKVLYISDAAGTGADLIYSMDLNGANQVQLTSGMVNTDSPVISPDGTKILYNQNSDIYSMGADGSNQVNLTNEPGVGSPDWSPDGTKIVFTGSSGIVSMNTDGSNPINLTNSPDGDPVWSPDGTKILFLSFRDGNLEIYVMDADGTNQTNLSNNPGFDAYAAWSPDGSKILFQTDRDGNIEIYSMDANGSNQNNLTNNAGDETNFFSFKKIWSPNGSQIVFSSDRSGLSEIYIMNADGSSQNKISSGVGGMFPGWSSDGTKIIFDCSTATGAEICSVNPGGTIQTNLTNSNLASEYLYANP